MTDAEIKEMQKVWSGFSPRLIDLLESRDAVRGILFVSHDDSGRGMAEKTAEHLADGVVPYDKDTKTAWRNKTAFLMEKVRQGSLLEDPPGYVSILVLDLDEKPAWLCDYLKATFEQAVRPCLICANAKDPDKIPDYLRSHFKTISKLGRPRKSS